jgi:tetratricopeptide (TPR) repeat protein
MKTPRITPLSTVLLLSYLLGVLSMPAYADNLNCGTLKISGNGPFDYRNERDELSKVEGAHFTEVVEALIRGTTNNSPGGDIGFTLAVFPNNHRALIAMMKLGEREKTDKPSGSRYSVECWFDRALRFRPDDSVVRMIYSGYLDSKGRLSDANSQLDAARAYAKDSAITHYNIGLHYLKLNNPEQALLQAHQAIALGWTQNNLRAQLLKIGKWREPLAQANKAPETQGTEAVPHQ